MRVCFWQKDNEVPAMWDQEGCAWSDGGVASLIAHLYHDMHTL